MGQDVVTFIANLARDSWNPPRLERATIEFFPDYVVITNRSKEKLRLDTDAAMALALVLRDRLLNKAVP